MESIKSIKTTLQSIWTKNWPEVQASLTGGLPKYIISGRPKPLGSDVPVFSFHVVSAEDFEADLNFLALNGYVTIDADSLLDHLEGRRRAPARAVVLSFDDGARNLFEIVYPLLQRFRMKGVAFIAPRFHEENGLIGPGDNLLRPLSWSQIREMEESGVIDFQSHTYDHRYIPRWPEPTPLEGSDPAVVVNALRGSALSMEQDFRLAKVTLEQKLNKSISHLAFPRYIGTGEALAIGRQCGYRAFWWGLLPGRPYNIPGLPPTHIIRVDGRFLRRLPGDKRKPLRTILSKKYGGSLSRRWPKERALISR